MFLNHRMKLICFLCMAALQVSLFASDSNNSPSIKPVQTNKNTGSQIEFEFSVEEKGDYYISFAMYGNVDEKYKVLIDGHKKGFLCLNKDGLQNAYYQKTIEGLDDKSVRLKKGSHTITVLENNEQEIPNVLEIKVGKSIDEIVFSIDKPSEQILDTPVNELEEKNVLSRANSPYPPYYRYSIEGNASFSGKTYGINLNLTQGMNVKLQVNHIYGYFPTIYFFKKHNTGSYTWTATGAVYNATGKLDIVIPVTGFYRCVIVGERSEGTTNLSYSVDGGTNYTVKYNCPVRIGTRRHIYRNNNPGTIFFTNTNDGGSGDPLIYIVDQSDHIVSWNDDAGNFTESYNSDLGRVFGLNSYCNWPGATSAQYVTVLLFSYSSNGSGSADVYGFVKASSSGEFGHGAALNKIFMKSSWDDVATPQNEANYNCYAWSGGMTDIPQSLEGNMSAYEDWITNKYSARYAGATTYERCRDVGDDGIYQYNWGTLIGVYAADAEIDLWGESYYAGYYAHHASVRRRANGHYHGFGWESKDALLNRYFHERCPQQDDSWDLIDFGHIICSYRPKQTASTALITTLSSGNTTNALAAEQTTVVYASTPKMEAMGINHPLSFDSSVALGLTVLRNATFTDNENEKIDKLIAAFSDDISSEFSSIFSAWKETWKDTRFTYNYNMKLQDKTKEHIKLKSFYKKHEKKLWPLLIKMVKEKHPDKELLLEDALSDIPMGAAIIDKINEELSGNQFTDDGALIVTDNNDRCIMICKKLLSEL